MEQILRYESEIYINEASWHMKKVIVLFICHIKAGK